uniref:glucuronosyltransferase n=1 Tax=Ditylenchus dipsaci TaxID=166011 RepID=A0A915D9E5_9BILA
MSYLFLNTNEVLDMPKPISPKVKYVGGIAIGKQGQSIDQEIEEVLSIPSKGTVLFSFGSLVKTSQIPYQLKYDDIEQEADLLRNYPNVHAKSALKAFITQWAKTLTSSWQRQVYRHSHPLFGDQFYNTGCALKNKVAVSLDKTRLTKQEVVDAYKQCSPTTLYNSGQPNCSSMAKKTSPRKTFVELVEYAAEFLFLALTCWKWPLRTWPDGILEFDSQQEVYRASRSYSYPRRVKLQEDELGPEEAEMIMSSPQLALLENNNWSPSSSSS